MELPGYGAFLARIALVTNQEFRLDIELQSGAVLHATDVSAPFSPVDRSSPALNTFVDGRELIAIPQGATFPAAKVSAQIGRAASEHARHFDSAGNRQPGATAARRCGKFERFVRQNANRFA